MVCDLDSFFVEGKKKMPKTHRGRYRLAPSGPDKEKQKNIFFPLGGGEKIKNEEKEIERERGKESF